MFHDRARCDHAPPSGLCSPIGRPAWLTLKRRVYLIGFAGVSSAPSRRTNGEKGWLWPRKLPISGIGIEDLQCGRYPCHTTRHAGPHRAARGFEVRTVSAPQSVKVRKGQDAVEQHAAVAPPAMTIARHLPGDIFAGPSALISR